MRLGLAGILIALALAAAVFFIERHRIGRLVNNRAAEIAATFNAQVRPLLDGPGVADLAALQKALNLLLITGKVRQSVGHLVFVGIYDVDDREVVKERDADYAHTNAVDYSMQILHRLPGDGQERHEIVRISGLPHVRLAFPLTDSSGERVATIEGLFALSATAVAEIEGRTVKSILGAICIVLLTTAILYPIMLTLINRLASLAANLLASNVETLRMLGSAVAKRDSDTDLHNYRVTIYAVSLAEAVRLKRHMIRELIKGAFLHDLGKIAISDRILLKPAKLTVHEYEIMKRHVVHGVEIIGRSEWLQDAAEVIACHHEQFDGNGYPHGLSGREIPINARIFAIADVFDALTSRRPYKEAMPLEKAIRVLTEGSGSHFAPHLLDAFLPIARSLYNRLAESPAQRVREEVEHMIMHYFSTEIGGLIEGA